MYERVRFGLYQSCENRGSIGHVSVFWLRWVGGLDQGLEGICVLCLADTCVSQVHPVFNHVAPHGYLLPNMYLFIADVTNPDSFV